MTLRKKLKILKEKELVSIKGPGLPCHIYLGNASRVTIKESSEYPPQGLIIDIEKNMPSEGWEVIESFTHWHDIKKKGV